MIEEVKKKICECLEIDSCKITVSTQEKFKDFSLNDIQYIKMSFGLQVRIVDDKGKCISTFYLTELSGCCGVCVSHGNNIYYPFQDKGLNKILNQFRKDIAKHAGYTVLLCTDIHNNIKQKKTLIRNGWKDIYQFRNKRTNNLIDISVVNLQE